MINKVILLGRLGKDPERISSGTKFVVATSEKYTKDGEKVEKTEWHNVIAFGKLGETCSVYLRKGSLIYIEGKITTTRKEDKYFTSIVAMECKFLSKDNETIQSKSTPEEQFKNIPTNLPSESFNDIPF